MNKKRVVTVILIIVMLLLAYEYEDIQNTKENYYRFAFVEATAIYFNISKILLIDTQEELDNLKDSVKESENKIGLLETNFLTAEGEKIIDNYLRHTYQAIDLKQKKFDESKISDNDGIYEVLDKITIQYREFARNVDEKEVELTF